MLGILSAEENRSGSRGNYYSYELDVPFESAIEAMEDALRLDAEIKAPSESGKRTQPGDHRFASREMACMTLSEPAPLNRTAPNFGEPIGGLQLRRWNVDSAPPQFLPT